MTVKSKILSLFPQRLPVDPMLEVLRAEKTAFGTRELVEYFVTPEERIRAYLLTPKGSRKRRPGVIAVHQHNCEFWIGKSEVAGLSKNRMYHYGAELCARGFVILCPDNLGFEERAPREIDRREGTRPRDREYEAFLFADQILKGSSLTAKYVFDLCQGLDVLQSLDRVAGNRLGAIGHSLGGQMVAWLAFYDSRVRCAFSSCGFSTMATIQRDKIPHNFAAYLPGLLTVGDMDDVIAGIAPRPFGFSSGTEDRIFPLDGVKRVKVIAEQTYPKGYLLTMIFEGGHQFPDSVKVRAYGFLKKFLKP